MGPALFVATLASAAPEGVDGLPVLVDAGDGWRASVRGSAALTIARDTPLAEFSLTFTPGVQLDFARLTAEEARADLEAELASIGSHFRWGEVTLERVLHPELGPMYVLATDGHVANAASSVQMRFATWAGPAGRLVLGGGIYADPGRADAVFAEALDRLVWRTPPIAAETFRTGRVALDGYSLDLPAGWRLAHPTESFGRTAEQTLAFDPGTRGGAGGLACALNTGPIEVIDPERSESHAAAFRAHARALLAGGGPGVREPRRAVDPRQTLQTSPVRIAPNEVGRTEVVPLGDREGYLWEVAATVGAVPVQVAVITTSFGTRTVSCAFVTAESAIAPAVLDALRSLRVTSGEPPARTAMGEYLRRWPFRHPLLQVWWLAAAALLAGGAVAVRAFTRR